MDEFVEYPQMLYKGEAHRIVDDAEAHEAAKAEGWLTWAEQFRPADPLDHDGDGKKGGAKRKPEPAPAAPAEPQE